MDENALVSVVVNNYNYGRFLRDAVDSALNQTYPHTEVVVVDDGSTDESREIIAGYGDRIVPVLQENGGQGSAFNAGFAASGGEIVLYLDADDYILPETIGRVVAAWEPGVAQVQYRLEKVDGSGAHLGFDPPQDLAMGDGEAWRDLLKEGSYVRPATSGLCFGRAVLERVLPVPESDYRRAADAYLANVAPFFGRVKALEEALGVYRIHGKNQYALEGVPDAERLRKMLRDIDKRHAEIARVARDVGLEIPADLGRDDYGGLVSRLILLRLEPEDNLVSGERRTALLYRGLRAVLGNHRFDRRKKLIHGIWFVGVTLLPLPLARRAIAWLYSPRSRPRTLERARRGLRYSPSRGRSADGSRPGTHV